MTQQVIERRFVPFTEFELREAGEDRPPELVGYAAVFNQEAVIADWFGEWREVMAPGAFKKTIKEGDVRALWNHDPSVVLGRNKAKTLQLKEDEHGLHSVIRPPDNEWGRPVLDAVRRGDVTGMSIAFKVLKEQVERPEKGSQEMPKRTIKEARLYDVSPVTYPAFEQTDIAARSQSGMGVTQIPEGIVQAPLQNDQNVDVLLRAAALVRWAQRGMVLTADELRTISEVVGIYRGVSGEPGQGHEEAPAGVDASAWHSRHSSEAQAGEPGVSPTVDVDHSPEARARRLRLIQIQMEEGR